MKVFVFTDEGIRKGDIHEDRYLCASLHRKLGTNTHKKSRQGKIFRMQGRRICDEFSVKTCAEISVRTDTLSRYPSLRMKVSVRKVLVRTDYFCQLLK